MTCNFDVVPFHSCYLEAASVLHQEGFKDFWLHTTLKETIAEDSVMAFAAILKNPTQNSENLIGFIITRIILDEAEILTVVVSPYFRRLGVGKSLLNRALTAAYQRGAEQIYLEVAEDNVAALNLYSLFGAKKRGERSGYYPSNKEGCRTAILLALKKSNFF